LNWFTTALDQKVGRYAEKIRKSTEAALILFVAIPLPGTGLWTGSMVASVLGFDSANPCYCRALGGLVSAIALTLVFSLIKYVYPFSEPFFACMTGWLKSRSIGFGEIDASGQSPGERATSQ
jgi:hypothetical protein